MDVNVRFNRDTNALQWYELQDGEEVVTAFISGKALFQANPPPWLERYVELARRLIRENADA